MRLAEVAQHPRKAEQNKYPCETDKIIYIHNYLCLAPQFYWGVHILHGGSSIHRDTLQIRIGFQKTFGDRLLLAGKQGL